MPFDGGFEPVFIIKFQKQVVFKLFSSAKDIHRLAENYFLLSAKQKKVFHKEKKQTVKKNSFNPRVPYQPRKDKHSN